MKFLIRKFYSYLTIGGICLSMIPGSAFGQMHPVAAESAITFTIRNFGFKTGGTLAAPDGDILFNPEDLSAASFKVSIKSVTINTNNESRDEHLRNEDYFDVKKYPLIHFVSSSISAKNKKGDYEAIGTLTIKDKTKEITLPFHAVKTGNGYLFTGSFTMNRKDYGIGGSSTISNELTVDIKLLAQ